MSDGYTVGRLAGLAGVTVRTLHHYDRIGLVQPSGRTAAGYRIYDPADIDRVRQVLTYRRLGFGLDEIAELLGDLNVDAVEHLRRQRALLAERNDRTAAMIVAIDHELEARAMGMRLTPEEQLEVFGTDKVGGEWADEAEQRWGDSGAYQQSRQRTAAYTKQDWVRIKAESAENLQSFADVMAAGVPATDPQAMEQAERARQHISRWFYECGYDMHRALAQMYVADERFAATYDTAAPGLAQYVHDAIAANADRHDSA